MGWRRRNTYGVTYYNGITTGFTDPAANYFSTSVATTYHFGGQTTKTWDLSLRVSSTGGGSKTAYGTVVGNLR